MSSATEVQTQQLSSIIEKLLSNGTKNLEVHDRYILPPHERPQMSEISHSECIPVVDLKDLDGPNRTTIVGEIRRACEEDGFFQVQSPIPNTQFTLLSIFILLVDFFNRVADYYISVEMLVLINILTGASFMSE